MNAPAYDNALIARAAEFAAAAHEGQVRKHTGEAYISHPAAVAKIAMEAGYDQNQVLAAWLHDVVEDCDYSVEDIRAEFGDDVAELVSGLTKPLGEGEAPRRERNEAYYQHLAVQSSRVKSVKVADMLHNSATVVDVDPKFAARYLPENIALLEVLVGADPKMLARLAAQLHEQYARLA